ncbi:hypothetical protein FB451DRAFT_1560029 [Mycena latifolia]|nr:hypothetical protein FB451DRAFT_1560029 [Mycena latifolia]
MAQTTFTSTPATLAPLAAFLTRPLARAYAPATVSALQGYLHNALAPCISQSEATLHLSPRCPPPAPLQAACLLTGVRWAAWARLLAAGLDLTLFVSQGAIAVKLGRMPRRVLWAAAAEAPAPRRVMLGVSGTTTRERRGAALHPTRVPTLLSSCTYASDLEPESDSDSDSDSDFESEYSSDFDTHSDSGSSASSFSSAPSVSELATYPVLRTKADVKRFLYAGGATHVVSGGVMLSARPSPALDASPLFNSSSAPMLTTTPTPMRPAPTSPSRVGTTARKPAASWRRPARAAAADAGSWRRAD